MRVHHLNNVSRALEVLKGEGVRLVNISNVSFKVFMAIAMGLSNCVIHYRMRLWMVVPKLR